MKKHDKHGLLDKYIDRVVGQESASIEYVSEFQKKKQSIIGKVPTISNLIHHLISSSQKTRKYACGLNRA